jgi:hypothetical protein
VVRGERPIKLGDSWFSAKSIEVDRQINVYRGVEHCMGSGEAIPTNPKQTPNTRVQHLADTLWELSSRVERETALTTC